MARKEEKQLELLSQHISCIQDGFSFRYIQFILKKELTYGYFVN
ncbi:hypothetical protein GsuE55_25990 [Geobacillus subterraneus]|uniref:Uncharacterized protein n=1 Tax=Geobacillus subterraneus TaxID=129338 RepID=A0A679FVM5_9BACL|nr:hypothetical protein GsuE55_25990 [Geobacillus subterraneus]